MLDPTHIRIPGLEVDSVNGKIAKRPDIPIPHSAAIGGSDSRDDGIPTREAPTATGDDITEGYGEGSGGGRNLGGGVDFFGSLGTERKRKDPDENKPDPNKVSLL
jgi:hypothetical protein